MKKNLAAAALLISIALSAFGYAFAHWSDTIAIEGTVEMGSLTLAFDWDEPPFCVEFHRNETGQLVPGEFLGKDVGKCSAWRSENVTDEHTGKKGYKKIHVLIENAYPQYIVHTIFVLHNIGTIPINVAKYEITGAKYNSTGDKIHDLLWDGKTPGGLYEDRNDNGVLDGEDVEVINIRLQDSLPYQLDPCNTNKQEMDLDFKQEAQECHTYMFTVEIYGIQWNKEFP